MSQSAVISLWQCQPTCAAVIDVVPDGCRDLLLRVDQRQQITLMMTNLDRGSYQVNIDKAERFYGIRLAAGSDISDSSVSASLLFKLQQVVEQPELIKQTLLEWQAQHVSAPDTLMSEFVASINEGVDFSGVSERTLRRRVFAVSGAAPSFWRRLYRARGVARALCAREFSKDSELAYQWGYADQSHLCRDMRHWFAQTPAGLRRESERYLPAFYYEDAFCLTSSTA